MVEYTFSHQTQLTGHTETEACSHVNSQACGLPDCDGLYRLDRASSPMKETSGNVWEGFS